MIEHLNNKYDRFSQALTSSNEEIIKNKILDMDFIIFNNLYDIFRYFDFNIKNIDQKDYLNMNFNMLLVEKLSKPQYLWDVFIDSLLKFIDKEDFLRKIFREKICYKEKLVNKSFMEILFDYISDLCYNNFRRIVIFLEKEQIMCSLIFNEEICKNEIIKKYIDKYISEINNEENQNFQLDNNIVSKKYIIYLLNGQKLPFMNNIFNDLFTYISKYISEKFLHEDTYFFYKYLGNEEINERQGKYKENLEKLNIKLKFEMNKYEIIIDILQSKNKELIRSFFHDLLFIYIQKNTRLQNNYSELSKVLDLLIQIRLKTRMNGKLSMEKVSENMKITNFVDLIDEEIKEKNKNNINTGDEYINAFLSIVNFLQSYAKEIKIILTIYYFLFMKIPNIYNEMLEIIKNKEIIMEESKKNQEYHQVNKASFFYIIEPMCKIIKKKIIYLFAEQKDDDMITKYNRKNYFETIRSFIYHLLKLDKKFMLFSNEIFFLDIIIKIIEKLKFSCNNEDNKNIEINDIILALGDFFSKIKDKSTLLTNFYITLTKPFEKEQNELCLIMRNILLNIYENNNDQILMKELLEKILLNPDYCSQILEYSLPIFNKIFYDIFQIDDIKFFEVIGNSSDEKLALIDKCLKGYKNSDDLCDIIFYKFEIFCNNFIDNNKNNLEQNLNDAIDFYYCKYEAKNNQIKLRKLYTLFSIAYIKAYLKYLVDILTVDEKRQNFPERKKILVTLFKMETNAKDCVIYYFLKLLYKKFDNNWDNFKKFYDEDNELKDYFSYLINFDDRKSFDFIPDLLVYNSENVDDEYIELLSLGDLNNKNNQKKFDELFLENKNYEYLYTFLSNLMILYYSYNEKAEEKKNCKSLLDFILKYLREHEIFKGKKNQTILHFFNLFFDLDNFDSIKQSIGITDGLPKEILINKEKITITNNEKIIILYNALRFIFSLLIHKNESKTENFYMKLMSKDISNVLDYCYIPGNFKYIDEKIKSFYEGKSNSEYIDKKNLVIYLCNDCKLLNFYYGKENNFKKYNYCEYRECVKCKNKIFFLKQFISIFAGASDIEHKIYIDEEKKKEHERNKQLKNGNIKICGLKDLEKEIKNEENLVKRGLNPNELDEDIFQKKEEKVREMSEFTYRMLNFILYSFILYGEEMKYIDKKIINEKYVFKNKKKQPLTPFEIMEYDWKIMEKTGKIDSVKIFLNVIFDDISKIFKEEKDFEKYGDRLVEFEKKIDKKIKKLKGNKELFNNFKIKCTNYLFRKKESSKVIIQELFPYSEYDKTKFQNFKYFYLPEMPNKKHFTDRFNESENNRKNYPIINSILNDENLLIKVNLMKFLQQMNEITNYMINNVSYKYKRDIVKKIFVKDELQIDNKIIELIKEFIPNYNKIISDINQKLGENLHQLNDYDNLKLGDLCIDSKKEGFGLCYVKMIEWQNSFIEDIQNSETSKLDVYKGIFDEPIMIQDCEADQIIDCPQIENDFNYKEDSEENIKFNLSKIIINNSFRKENKVEYNFDEIENQLISHIFTRIKKFKNEIREVVYQYEFSFDERSKIIHDFKEKYKQRELNEKESNDVISTLLNNQKRNEFDIKNIIFCLNVLIEIILEKNIDAKMTLFSFINTESNCRKAITNQIKEFFQILNNMNKENDDEYLNINCLINLIEFLELFIWENIKMNLELKYKEDIDNTIKEYFKDSEDLDNEKKLILCSVIRKFISRYLSEKNGENIKNIKTNNSLDAYLLNEEFWPENLMDDRIFFLMMLFGDKEIKVFQAYKLYEYLGGDEIILTNIINKYKENNKKKEEENEGNEGKNDPYSDDESIIEEKISSEIE